MSSGLLYLNDLEVETNFGLIVTNFGALQAAPGRSVPMLDIPGYPGALDPGLTPREAVRTFTVNCLVQAASAGALTTTLDAVKEVCGTGLVKIVTAYDTSRALYGVLQTLDAAAFVPTLFNGWASVALQFACANPYWVAVTPDVIAFDATAVAIPTGTAPSVGRDEFSAIIEIVGAATTPTLSELDSAGNTVGTMVFTFSPTAGNSLVIDVGRKQVWRVTSGTWTSAFGDLTAGYTWPRLSPDDGNATAETYPQLKVSSGSGSIRRFMHYR